MDDEEFEELIDIFEDDNCFSFGKDDMDFVGNVKKRIKGVKDNILDEDLEGSDDEFGNLDDDEVFLGSMDDEEFVEVDEDGGIFMDVLDDESESVLEFEVYFKVSIKKSKRKGIDDFDFVGLF